MGLFGDPISSEMGSCEGDPFTDLDLSGSSGSTKIHFGYDWKKKITKVELRAGNLVDAIRIRYGETWSDWHGGQGGELHCIDLEGLHIFKIEAYYDRFINSIKFFVSDGTVHGPFGICNGLRKETVYQPAENRGLLSFISGSASSYINKLRLHFEANMSSFNIGGQGGSGFSDFHLSGSNSYSMFRLDQRITGVGIRAGHCVDALRFRYGHSWAPWHGQLGGNLHQFEFEDSCIKSVEVYYGDFINAIKFVMSNNLTFGPFGEISGKCQVASYHSAEQGLLSFIKGSSGMLLDRLELYFEDLEAVHHAQSLCIQQQEALERQQQHQDPQTFVADNFPVLMEMPKQQEPEDPFCAICLDPSSPRNAVFIPCGHLQTCMSCALEIKNDACNPVCPICRAQIKDVYIVFM